MPDANSHVAPTYQALVEQALVGVYVVQDGRTRTEHDGRPAVTGTMIDATEPRERERALQAREQRLRGLIENAADGLARFERDISWTIDQLLEHADEALYGQKRLRRP